MTQWPRRLEVVLVVGLLVLGGLAGFAVSEWAEADQDRAIVTDQYEDTRDDVVGLCDDKANANKPECVTEPPTVTELVGPPGPPGPGPTASQIRSAVNELLPVFVGPGIADYCAGGRCDGEDGAEGAAGRDGVDGRDGLDGVDGAPGKDGTDGRGVSSFSCNDEGRLVAHYTDGETQTIDGSSCVTPPPQEGTGDG